VLGREAIRALLRDFHSAAERHCIISITHIESSGDLAYVIGSYAATIRAPNGSVLYHEGNLLETWRQASDGTWWCVANMYVSDAMASTE